MSRKPRRGLAFSGGESQEELIPAGDNAVLSNVTNIDGENHIQALVGHTINGAGTTSTFMAYFIDDDTDNTIKSATNTRGYVLGSWSRVKIDAEGIDDSIIDEHTETINGNQVTTAAFLGIVPSLENLVFDSYEVVGSTSGMSAGSSSLQFFVSDSICRRSFRRIVYDQTLQ